MVTAASHNSPEPFLREVTNGVSANLCEAVADLATVGGEGMEISRQWSTTHSLPGEMPAPLFVSKNVAPYIRAAAVALRASTPIEDAEVRGFVERALKRTGAVSGKVTIVGNVEGQSRRVEATLGGDLYRLAVQAHKEEKPISCYGTVERKGSRYILSSLHDFQIDA